MLPHNKTTTIIRNIAASVVNVDRFGIAEFTVVRRWWFLDTLYLRFDTPSGAILLKADNVKSMFLAAAVGLVLVGGCEQKPAPPRSTGTLTPRSPASASSQSAAAGLDAKVASSGSIVITRKQLTDPLIEAYGLDFLVQLMTLRSAEEMAKAQGIAINEADLKAELTETINGMVKDAPPEDHDRLLQSFLTQQHITRTQFDLLMKTNAYLRKLADGPVRKMMTDEVLHQAFGTMYGENVRVRHIQLSNMQEVAEAQRRLAGGEDFAEVARTLSRNARTAPNGGMMVPFSRNVGGLPDLFKQTAFALKVGEVSDAVLADDSYHLIKLEERIAPKAVEFDTMRPVVEKTVYDNFMLTAMRRMRASIRQDVIARLDIDDPILLKQYKAETQPPVADETDKQRMLKDLKEQREQAGQPAATLPSALPPLKATTRQIVPTGESNDRPTQK